MELADGDAVPLDVLLVTPQLDANAELASCLGVEAVEHASGSVLECDDDGRTAVPGLWLAGNVADLAAQVVVAAAAGFRAAVAINAALVDADVEQALGARIA